MRSLALLFLLAMPVLGFVSFWLQHRRRQEKMATVRTFARKFEQFEQEHRERATRELYEWLMKRVLRVQKITSEEIASSEYEQFFRDERGRTGRILVDVLEQMGQYPVPEQRTVTVKNYLTRYIGIGEEEMERVGKQLVNPLRLFREGIRVLVRVPELVWRWATGRPLVDVLTAPDAPRMVRRSSILAVIGLFLPLFLLFVGTAPIEAAWISLADWADRSWQAAGQLLDQLLVLTGMRWKS